MGMYGCVCLCDIVSACVCVCVSGRLGVVVNVCVHPRGFVWACVYMCFCLYFRLCLCVCGCVNSCGCVCLGVRAPMSRWGGVSMSIWCAHV